MDQTADDSSIPCQLITDTIGLVYIADESVYTTQISTISVTLYA